MLLTKLILFALLLATVAARAGPPPSVDKGNNAPISTGRYRTSPLTGFVQSARGQPDFSFSALRAVLGTARFADHFHQQCYPCNDMRTLHTIDYSEARRAVDLIVERASQMQKAVVIAVSDAHGDLVAFARMDNAPIASIHIAMNKAWTAARERKPTKEIGEKVKHPEKGHDISYYGDPKYVGWGGGVPVRESGEVIGSVAVSGLSSDEDAALATLAAELIGSS